MPESLTGVVGGVTDQSVGSGGWLYALGIDVVKLALDKTQGQAYLHRRETHECEGQRRVLQNARNGFMQEKIFRSSLVMARPMDYAHPKERVVDGKSTGFKLLPEDINFFDDEIVRLAKSGGIFGLQWMNVVCECANAEINQAFGVHEQDPPLQGGTAVESDSTHCRIASTVMICMHGIAWH